MGRASGVRKKQRLGKHVPEAKNTSYNKKIVGCVIFCGSVFYQRLTVGVSVCPSIVAR
jgi:hypothetical protein